MTSNTGGHFDVIVVGGGHAGLAMSYWLKQYGINHVVIDSSDIAGTWRAKRWDSFCLVTPNWQCTLPGFPYDGNDPDGFMVKDEIVNYFERYVESFGPPLRANVTVDEITRIDGCYQLQTTAGLFTADSVVVATSNYHYPQIPGIAQDINGCIVQLHSSEYRNSASLPEGAVVVVGTGQSGCQIAEDLHLEGRRVHLSVGRAPRVAREHRGQDVVKWLDQMGHYKLTVDDHPAGTAVRFETNHYVTGRSGGHEINLRDFAAEGMRLYGRLKSGNGSGLKFDNDLIENLNNADAVATRINGTIDDYIANNRIDAPAATSRPNTWEPTTRRAINFADEDIGAIVWATGYGLDFGWINAPVFDSTGYPIYHRGVTDLPGLYFVGLNWLWTWGSGRIYSVGDDAKFIGDHIRATGQ
jgi:putative flavoprotein involved in K+ transport